MNTALSIRNLYKTYSGGVEALRGIDLDVQEGDFYALLGPNGAGKSTLIGILTNLVDPTEGEIRVFGVDARADSKRARAMMGVVPQEFNFNVFEKSLEILVFQAGLYGIPRNVALPRAQELLERLGLGDQMNQIARHLSGGMKRRLMVARALVNNPRLLILDEPTAGVDIELRRGLWEILTDLNQKGTTIILTTHYLEEAENLCRNLAIIDHGRILEQGPIRDLVRRLEMQTFILDLAAPATFEEPPAGFRVRPLDPRCLEIDVPGDLTLNQVFAALETCGVEVISMRNKANRLEELFVHLVGRGGQ
jgi:ABC-2 type transport system ATP-binding protein